MWCEIIERKIANGKLLIRICDDNGNEVHPKMLQDLAGNKYTGVYKPEWSPFFELRPLCKEKKSVYKDRIEVLD